MKVIEIPKRGGGIRRIYVPGGAMRHRLATLMPDLECAASIFCRSCVHGFRSGRSPLTAAREHVGRRFTLSCDVADFYDSITLDQVATAWEWWTAVCMLGGFRRIEPKVVTWLWRAATEHAPGDPPSDARQVARILTVDGAPRQGLPSSPIVANLAACPLDYRILDALPPGGRWVYTRYADDLSISADDGRALRQFHQTVTEPAVAAMGWRLNGRKTRFMDARFGRRAICGISVGDDLRVPRSFRRKLRAARHRAGLGAPFE